MAKDQYRCPLPKLIRKNQRYYTYSITYNVRIISMSITAYYLNHKLIPTPGIPASSNLASGGQFRCKGFGKNLA